MQAAVNGSAHGALPSLGSSPPARSSATMSSQPPICSPSMKICGTVRRPCARRIISSRRFGSSIHVDFGVGDALALQKGAGASTKRAPHRRVEFDLGHLDPSRALRLIASAGARHIGSTRRCARPAPGSGRRHERRRRRAGCGRIPRPSRRWSARRRRGRPACRPRSQPRRNAKAPRTLRARARGPRRPWDGVRRRRSSQSGATGGPPAERIARASRAAWL